MKKTIPILLIIMGLILISIPTINNQIVKTNVKSKATIAERITYEEIRVNIETDAEFDYTAITDVDIVSAIFGSINFDSKSVIGQISIPDLDIDLPILKGVTNANLAAGAATLRPDQEMGIGNYPLSGHLMKNKDLLFGRLMDIELASKVYITDKNTIYEYEIYHTIVVPDTAMDMLEDIKSEEKEEPIISLMTCYYSSKTEKRFFALGRLVDEYPVEEGDIE